MGICYSGENPENQVVAGGNGKPTKRTSRPTKRISAKGPATITAFPGAPGARELLEKYSMKKKLGAGNYSVVRKAVNRATGEEVAVKCILKNKLKPTDLDSLQSEAEILQQTNHPHVIQYHEHYEDEKMVYIVMEYVRGGELFEKIVEKEYYGEEDAQQILKTLAETLGFLHAKGVVHRDLKPENILLTGSGDDADIVLADFGFAKKVSKSETEESTARLRTACGTPGYVAPEIISGIPYDSKCDVWSLGVITYILLCGYPPFRDTNKRDLYRRIRAGAFEFDSPWWDEVSDVAKDLIKCMLTVKVSERYSMEDVLNHPWLSSVKPKDITPALSVLKRFNARRKLAAGMTSVLAVVYMTNFAGGGGDIAEEESGEEFDADVGDVEVSVDAGED